MLANDENEKPDIESHSGFNSGQKTQGIGCKSRKEQHHRRRVNELDVDFQIDNTVYRIEDQRNNEYRQRYQKTTDQTVKRRTKYGPPFFLPLQIGNVTKHLSLFFLIFEKKLSFFTTRHVRNSSVARHDSVITLAWLCRYWSIQTVHYKNNNFYWKISVDLNHEPVHFIKRNPQVLNLQLFYLKMYTFFDLNHINFTQIHLLLY